MQKLEPASEPEPEPAAQTDRLLLKADLRLQAGYVIVRDGALYLIGSHISPLPEASTHVKPDPVRTRKLLLKEEEIKRLIGKVEQRGHTLVPLDMHYKNGRIKLEIGLGRGKQKADKRETEKKREWSREKQRLMKSANR